MKYADVHARDRIDHAPAGELEGPVLPGDPRGARQLMAAARQSRDVTLQYRTADQRA